MTKKNLGLRLVVGLIVAGSAGVSFWLMANMFGGINRQTQVLGVSVGPISGTSALISWDDQGNGGWLEYGLDQNYQYKRKLEPTQTQIELENLVPDQRYYVRITFLDGGKTWVKEYQFYTK